MAKLLAVLCLFVSTVTSVEVSDEAYDARVNITAFSLERKQNVDIYWRDYDGTVPKDPVSAGISGIYIAQIIVEKCANVPGTYYHLQKEAITSAWGKKVTAKSNFKILCTSEPHRLRWQHVNAAKLTGAFLNNCVKAGFEDNSDQYVGKTYHEGVWKIGKVFPVSSKFNGLKAWYNKGGTYTAKDFEILMFD